MATGYTITNLDSRLKSYLETNGVEILTKALFNSESAKYFNIQTGVTADQPIIRLDSSITLADASTCGFEATGEDTFTNRILSPKFLKLNKEFCPKDLLKTWAHSEVKMSATGQELPFEELLIDSNVNQLAKVNEQLIWEGDITNGTGNLALMDGIITIARADANTVKIDAGTDSLWTRVQKTWLALDPAIADKCTVFMSIANYKQLIVDLMNANQYHIFEEYNGEYKMTMPGTNLVIRGVSGITQDVIVATPEENLYLGVDAESDNEVVDLYFDKSDRTFKFVIEYAYATQYAFSEFVYLNEATDEGTQTPSEPTTPGENEEGTEEEGTETGE